MSDNIIVSAVYLALSLGSLLWLAWKRGWYSLSGSKDWPIIDAEIQRAGTGAFPKAATASFFAYRFVVDGIPRLGIFAFVINEEDSRLFQNRLAGNRIRIRYDPRDPNTSFLLDPYDPLFMGRAAMQGPEILDYAPEFHLADAIRKD
jgi:hypothetical protein